MIGRPPAFPLTWLTAALLLLMGNSGSSADGVLITSAAAAVPSAAWGQVTAIRSCPPVSFEEVAGFSSDAVSRFSSFDDYLKTRELSAEGFALEWMVANDRSAAPDGRCNRIPSPKNGSVDIETVDSKGNVVDSYQCKRQLTVEHINAEKYDNLKFITSRESRARLIKDLAAEEAKAARRGIALAPTWQKVRKLVDSGGLVDSLNLSRKPLPTLSTLRDVARRELKAVWDFHIRAKPGKVRITARQMKIPGAKLPLKVAAVGGVAAAAVEAAMVWYRYDKGELKAADLPEEIVRGAVRVAIVAGAEGAIFALMATPTGWVVIGVGIGAGLLATAADAAIDWWKTEYGHKTLTTKDLISLLPDSLHADLRKQSALDRWEASRNGDMRAWDPDWAPATPTSAEPK